MTSDQWSRVNGERSISVIMGQRSVIMGQWSRVTGKGSTVSGQGSLTPEPWLMVNCQGSRVKSQCSRSTVNNQVSLVKG